MEKRFSKSIECFMVMAGKAVTEDGSVMIAHNLELGTPEVSIIEKHPATKHPPGAQFEFPTGLIIPECTETYEWIVLRIHSSLSANAVAVNEYGVSLGGGLNLMKDLNPKAIAADPTAEKGVCGSARYIALIRAKTAKEAVRNLGEMYTQYGSAYQCAVAYADPDEIWYIESGGGHSWAAIRIPEDRVWVQANAFRIAEIDPSDTANILTSPSLLSFSRDKGLWDPAEGKFNFRKAFGGRTRGTKKNEMREWRAMDMLSPSSGFKKESLHFPMTCIPDKEIGLSRLFSVLRDQKKMGEFQDDDGNMREIKIGSNRIIHSDVVQIRRDMPVDIGAVMWSALSIPTGSIYLPFYFGLNKVPPAYGTGSRDDGAAHFVYKEYHSALQSSNGHSMINELRALETSLLENQAQFEKSIMDIYTRDMDAARKELTEWIHDVSNQALKKTKAMITAERAGRDS